MWRARLSNSLDCCRWEAPNQTKKKDTHSQFKCSTFFFLFHSSIASIECWALSKVCCMLFNNCCWWWCLNYSNTSVVRYENRDKFVQTKLRATNKRTNERKKNACPKYIIWIAWLEILREKNCDRCMHIALCNKHKVMRAKKRRQPQQWHRLCFSFAA